MGLDIHIHLDLDLDMSKEMGSLLNNLMETYMLELYIHCPVKDRHKMGLYNWFHRLVNNTVEYNIRLLGLGRNRLEELYNSHQENNKVKHINLVLHSQILVMHNRFQVCSKEKCMFHQVNNRQENSKSV